jgi:hypothetical protein
VTLSNRELIEAAEVELVERDGRVFTLRRLPVSTPPVLPANGSAGIGASSLPERPPCPGCAKTISAYAAEGDRFCWSCAPRVTDEPDTCRRGHPKSLYWVRIRDHSTASGFRGRCMECKRENDRKRDQSKAAKDARRTNGVAA